MCRGVGFPICLLSVGPLVGWWGVENPKQKCWSEF